MVAALPTINYLIRTSSKMCSLFSHLGKVKTEEDKAKNDLAVVAPCLEKHLGKPVTFVNATRGPVLEDAIKNAADGAVILVQNTRYEAGESKNDPELRKILGIFRRSICKRRIWNSSQSSCFKCWNSC